MSLNLFLYHSKNNNYFYTNQKTALLFQTRRFYYSDNAALSLRKLLPFTQFLISLISQFSKLLGLGEQFFCFLWEGLQQ